LEFVDFVRHQMIVTTIYQDNYVEPKTVDYQFPEQKRNLIYIFLESMEVTYTTVHEGGARPVDLIPELRELAQTNVNFSPNAGFGGGYTLPGTTWTMAAMVGQTSGLPLKLPFDGEQYYGNYSKMLPGAWTLGDILEQAGYHQVLLMGSDSSFAGRGDYFTQHGNYEINDYNTALQDGRLPTDYHEWWGYEDRKLFDYAKEELLRLAEADEPFNLTMLTADTHFEDGYVCPQCPTYNKEQYANVIRCSSYQVYEFVKWIQEQDFYENTTIVISGDHLSMDSNFFNKLEDDYERQVYQCIIHPAVEDATLHEKQRIFTTLDMFPTTLAALGVTFNSDRLALGTNLFSGAPTLAEELGMEELTEQLSRNSNYYNYHFLYAK
jgi:phosphoglycerol transferase